MVEILTPEELNKEGQAAYKSKDYPAAAGFFESAAQGYQAAGNQLAAAEMRNNCSVAYLQAGEAQLALEAAQGTDAVFAEAGDVARQGMALGNVAAALEKLGELETAATTYERSADLLKQAGEGELRASVMQALSAIQLRLGRQLEAVVTMQAGLDGIKHPSPKQRLVKKLLNSPINMLRPK